MQETSEIWTGEASRYERTRPAPPAVLLDVLARLIHMPRPALVVDLGSGTGLSTRLRGERAERVIGREAALQHIGSEPIPWYLSYRVRIGVK